MSQERAIGAVEALGLAYTVTRHGRVSSLAEAAAARGIEPRDLVKTLVVRRGDDDYLFVLEADALIAALGAQVADISDAEA